MEHKNTKVKRNQGTDFIKNNMHCSLTIFHFIESRKEELRGEDASR